MGRACGGGKRARCADARHHGLQRSGGGGRESGEGHPAAQGRIDHHTQEVRFLLTNISTGHLKNNKIIYSNISMETTRQNKIARLIQKDLSNIF